MRPRTKSNTQRETFLIHASSCAAVWKQFGALTVVDCSGDDVPHSAVTFFPLAVKLEPGEVAIFSWITWPSRVVRDERIKNFMVDPCVHSDVNPVPFDGKRLIDGGYQVVNQL